MVVYDETLKPRVLVESNARAIQRAFIVAGCRRVSEHIEHERPDSDFLARMTYLELKLRLAGVAVDASR